MVSGFHPLIAVLFILYGVTVAGHSGIFVGLIGDTWGSVALIEDILKGNVYPLRDPFNKGTQEVLFTYPPMYFWVCAFFALIGSSVGLETYWSFHVTNILIRFFFHYTFYLFCQEFLRNKRQARMSLVFSAIANSLSWVRLVGVLLLNLSPVIASIIEIMSGNTALTLDPSIKDKINYVMYQYWDLRHNILTQRYNELAYVFGFLSFIFSAKIKEFREDWKYIIGSGGFLGLAIITTQIATLGFNSLFFMIIIIRLIKNKKMPTELLIFIIGNLIGVISTFWLLKSLFDGSVYWVIESGITNPGWGFRTAFGRPQWPYPWETLEAYGLIFPLGLFGIYLQYKEGNLEKFSYPFLMGCWGITTVHLQWVGIEISILLRQIKFLFFSLYFFAPFALEYLLQKIESISSLKPRRVSRYHIKLFFVSILCLSLFMSYFFGIFIFNLRKAPIHFVVNKYEYAGIIWLDQNTQDDQVVYASDDVSRKIPALSGNKVVLGHVSLYSLTNDSERVRRRQESVIVFNEDNYQESEEIIKQYNSSFLFVVLDELPDAKLRFFEGRFERVFENEDVMIFKVT